MAPPPAVRAARTKEAFDRDEFDDCCDEVSHVGLRPPRQRVAIDAPEHQLTYHDDCFVLLLEKLQSVTFCSFG